MSHFILPIDRARAAREYERCGLPIGAKAVRMGRLDNSETVQEAARRRLAALCVMFPGVQF